ncbi:GGDEF and EAL domain-containing protein [Paenalkalicoccus suaedae]|uniref:GGDEF and EAL domain-containing protein n=1 Tax=Paenalkalicoccus suaedae TaxID=2592382 RepID=A0A859FJJ7_9BACI|nr:EAL domain-containing protein [Paenalkalicoccus suaedae]QKS72977.1 GGDEF and EAL domain-containing protein [Paenalkalicoccus suaedae]
MGLNAGPIYSALIIAIILFVYSRGGQGIDTLQNKLFRSTLVVTILSMLALLMTVYIESNADQMSTTVQHANNIFTRLLMIGVFPLIFYYSTSIIWKAPKHVYQWIKTTSFIYLLFAVLVMISPFTGLIYQLEEGVATTPGPLYLAMYIVPIFYLSLIVLVVYRMRNKLPLNLRLVLLSYPLLGLALAGVEFIFPELLISSTAVTAGLTITYLYVQNKKILEDDLTGVLNRRAFTQILKMRLENREDTLITLVSLHDFKSINDQYGEEIGDQALHAFAKYLSTLSKEGRVCRFSGDEFAIVSSYTAEADCMQAIHTRLQDTWDVNGIVVKLRATIVTIPIPKVTGTIEDTVAVLERQVKMNKKAGIEVDTITTHALVFFKRRQTIEEILKKAIHLRNVDVYFQPIYCVKTGEFRSLEALARLHSAELGFISPGEFIPIAEEKGLIQELGEVLLEVVCQAKKRLRIEGISIDQINVNISPIQIFHDRLMERVLDVSTREQVDCGFLHFELTESVVLDNMDKMKVAMEEFEALGIGFSLDDYGTGYTNISNVIQFPFSCIKLDKTLLYEAERNEDNFIVIQALAQSFRQIGKHVVVEGVETQEQLELAYRMGSNFVQGYYFARPMPLRELVRFYKDNRVRTF